METLASFLPPLFRPSAPSPPQPTGPVPNIPVSVNYFPSRKCNKECGFCFHTAKDSSMLPLDDAKNGLRKLAAAGMKKLNIAGGEPFLHPKFVLELCRFSKEELGLESISIVSNGSLIKEKWLRDYRQHIDILAISCDSFDEATNIRIGRGSGDSVKQLFKIRDWCLQYRIMFKLNTVVCQYNYNEDMAARVAALGPFRWKVFQVLRVKGENDSPSALRDVTPFEIDDEQFQVFCSKHKHLECFVPEPNQIMSQSYLLVDEYMRFVDGNDKNNMSQSILEVDVKKALTQIPWDYDAFQERGGVYEWSNSEPLGDEGCGSAAPKGLDW